MPHNWKLSPSDFAFLWEECPRCFYLQTVRGMPRPRGGFPRIFGVIDEEMKKFYAKQRTETIAEGVPKGVVGVGDAWVESAPITVPKRKSACFLRGKLDTVLNLDDGSYAVVDFKTSAVKEDHVKKYSRQLHAYGYALENASMNGLSLKPVSKLGLLVFEPEKVAGSGSGLALTGPVAWLEIPRNDGGFMEFLSEVLAVLDMPSPPKASPGCGWCRYRDQARKSGL